MWLLWLWLDGTVVGSSEDKVRKTVVTEIMEEGLLQNEADTTLLIGTDTTRIAPPTPVEVVATPASETIEAQLQ